MIWNQTSSKINFKQKPTQIYCISLLNNFFFSTEKLKQLISRCNSILFSYVLGRVRERGNNQSSIFGVWVCDFFDSIWHLDHRWLGIIIVALLDIGRHMQQLLGAHIFRGMSLGHMEGAELEY